MWSNINEIAQWGLIGLMFIVFNNNFSIIKDAFHHVGSDLKDLKKEIIKALGEDEKA